MASFSSRVFFLSPDPDNDTLPAGSTTGTGTALKTARVVISQELDRGRGERSSPAVLGLGVGFREAAANVATVGLGVPGDEFVRCRMILDVFFLSDARFLSR